MDRATDPARLRGLGAAIFAIVLLVAAPCPAATGDDPEPAAAPAAPTPVVRPFGFHRLADDTRYLAALPWRLDRKGRNRALVVTWTTAGLYVFRREIRDWALDHRSGGTQNVLDDARIMGKGAFAPGLALIAYTASLFTDRDRERETAQMLLESVAFSAIGAAGGQFVLATERPEDGDAVRLFRTRGHGVSGDAAIAASVVEPLRCQYLRVRPGDSRGKRIWKRTASGVLYAGVALTAYQRIYADKHWAPDAFLGTAVGLGVGRALCRAHEGEASR